MIIFLSEIHQKYKCVTTVEHIEWWIASDGDWRKALSAVIVDGIKRDLVILVGYSIFRNTHTRLNKTTTLQFV